MGQWHVPVNLDRKEALMPHTFGDALELVELAQAGSGTMAGLAILLASSNGRGDGDLPTNPAGTQFMAHKFDDDEAYAAALAEHVVGRWAGDRIAIVGDYSERDDLPDDDAQPIYEHVRHGTGGWRDISTVVIDALYMSPEIAAARAEQVEFEGSAIGTRSELYPGFRPARVARLHPDGRITTQKRR